MHYTVTSTGSFLNCRKLKSKVNNLISIGTNLSCLNIHCSSFGKPNKFVLSISSPDQEVQAIAKHEVASPALSDSKPRFLQPLNAKQMKK